MTDQEILTKAIQKAIDGGWEQDLIWVHGNVKNKNEVFMKQLEIDSEHIYWAYDEYISVPELIFSHKFAKALWGKEPDHHDPNAIGTPVFGKNGEIEAVLAEHLYNWSYHLQQMAIAEDPIKYLGANI